MIAVLAKKDFIASYKLSLKTNGINLPLSVLNEHCDEFVALITSYIKSGYVIRFQGCGAIVVREKSPRKGFNFKTGASLEVAGRQSCSMERTVRTSLVGIIQYHKVTTQKMRDDLGDILKNAEAADIFINTFIRTLKSVLNGNTDKFTLQALGSFSLRKTRTESSLIFSASHTIKSYLKSQT